MRRSVALVAATLVLGYLGVCALLYFNQRALVFPAPRERAPAPGVSTVEVPDGTFMVIRAASPSAPVLVYLHGNGDQVGWFSWLAAEAQQRGFSFVAIEYPGYPGAPGEPSEAAILSASERALELLVQRGLTSRDAVLLVGQSLGTGVAAQLVSRGWGRRLVLLTPYTSLPAVGARAFPWVPVRLLMKDRFDTLAIAPLIRVPTLIVHGTDDEVVPFDMGLRLRDAIAGAQLLEIPGGHHNDLWDRPVVPEQIFSFLKLE